MSHEYEKPGNDRKAAVDMSDPSNATLIEAAIIGNLDEVNSSLADGVDPNASDEAGFTPLHFAAQNESSETARVLLAAGAAVDTPNVHGNTPLSIAVFNYEQDGSVIELLLENGADPYQKNKAGVTPVELARGIANYDVAKYFEVLP